MLPTLFEYLTRDVERHKTKVVLRFVSFLLPALLLWFLGILSNWLYDLPPLVLWSLLALSIGFALLIYLYSRFLRSELSLEGILKNYNHDDTLGTFLHKQTGIAICKNCLFKTHQAVPLRKWGSAFKCDIKDCEVIYHEYRRPSPPVPPVFGKLR